MIAIFAAMANAEVIVADSFAGNTDGDQLSQNPPKTSLPGSGWVRPTNANEFYIASAPWSVKDKGALGVPQSASAISIQSAGSYY